MRRTQIAFISAGLLFGSLSLIPAAQAAGETTDNVPPPPQIQPANPTAQPGDNNAQPGAAAHAQPQAPMSSDSNDGITPTTPSQSAGNPGKPNYDLSTIIIDYKEHKIGDTVPDKYRSKTYTITEWQKRNLPAPQPDTHWAYINANYILITNDTGKIVMGKSGDIFFRG
ncbi:Ni/Co efflux regulator RcnB [Pantoea sp. PA1]|jgi:Ni/Co efflux regulator RcnB|uniref:RcnB family protein n=1 Tax=Pantoea TaxID=53335 RepID=UPI000E25EBDB|nr:MULTISPECIES: RcnB family protein [Pantoea]MCS4494544.1 RcnB family protein [Pantoea sp. B623]MDH0055879.1 RcnB family protein [Pantoea ananatis]NEK80935.1 RcnB family protein [Pantoea ananatis]REF07519.1 Ni/Co efflux regulator RcnB [Pantoea ananatis]UEG17549.1 RcnB family protein [Pantoea ananatis]